MSKKSMVTRFTAAAIGAVLAVGCVDPVMKTGTAWAAENNGRFQLEENMEYHTYIESGMSINDVHVHMIKNGRSNSFDNCFENDTKYNSRWMNSEDFTVNVPVDDVEVYGEKVRISFDRTNTKYIEITEDTTKDIIFSKHYDLVDGNDKYAETTGGISLDADFGRDKVKKYTVKVQTVSKYTPKAHKLVYDVPTTWSFNLNVNKSAGRLYIRPVTMEGDYDSVSQYDSLTNSVVYKPFVSSYSESAPALSCVVLSDSPIDRVTLDGQEIKNLRPTIYPDCMVVNKSKDYYRETDAESYYHTISKIYMDLGKTPWTHHIVSVTDINGLSKTVEFDGGARERRALKITSNLDPDSSISYGWRYKKYEAGELKRLYQDIYEANKDNSGYLPVAYQDNFDTQENCAFIYDPVYGVDFSSLHMDDYLYRSSKDEEYMFYGWYDEADTEFANRLENPIPATTDPVELMSGETVRLVARYVTKTEYEKLRQSEKDTTDKPTTDKPADDKPAADKPTIDKPADDKTADDKPATDKPANDKPADDKPATDAPTVDMPSDRDPIISPEPAVNNVKKINITFAANGGKISGKSKLTKTYRAGVKYSSLPVPQRKGYTFAGWFTQKSGGTRVSQVCRKSNATVYAHWNRIITPGKVTIAEIKLSKNKQSAVIKYKKCRNATGYEIQYCSNNGFSKAVTLKCGVKTLSKRIGTLKKKQYYVRVRAVRRSQGKVTYGKWSKTCKINR